MKKIAINASNLHVGGGVQVACSFFHEISVGDFSLDDFYFFVSTEVDDNLKSLKSPICQHLNYKVVDVYGMKALLSPLNKILIEFDLVFTVFGPSYFIGLKGITVEGFALPWILDNSYFRILNKKAIIKSYINSFVRKVFFKRIDKLVVELEHVKQRLVELKISDKNNISVVYNTCGSIYSNPDQWESVAFEREEKDVFTLGYLTRDYLHKNTIILPEVKNILKCKYKLNVEIVVTFTEDEWLNKSEGFRKSIKNIGSLKVSQCPSFYEKIDAVIFPSLLECFSATPLEAMVMEKPLFCSDRHFVKDVCGNYAYYFDPLSPDSIAEVIARYILEIHGTDAPRLKEAKQYAKEFSSPAKRAREYMNIIDELNVLK